MSPPRRSLLLAACLLASVALAAVASAQEGAAAVTRTFTIAAQEDNAKCPEGAGPCWDVAVLVVAPGDLVSIVTDLRNAGIPHDITVKHPDGQIQVPPGGRGTTGEIVVANFTFPEGAKSMDFLCSLHPQTMTGKLAIASELGVAEEEAIPELGVNFLSYWVGLIAFLILFLVYGATFFLFKYNETPATTDQWDRSGEGAPGGRRFSGGMTSILAILLAAAVIAGIIFLAGR